MKGLDITEQINDLKNMQDELKDSRIQYKLLISPKEEFIVSRLKTVKNIDKIEAATEEHDPNGQLNKPGGYTAQIYFSSPLVEDEYGIFTGVPQDAAISRGKMNSKNLLNCFIMIYCCN